MKWLSRLCRYKRLILWLIGFTLVTVMGATHALDQSDRASKSENLIVQSQDTSLSHSYVEKTLQARGLVMENLKPRQRSALLEELFIRESLIQSAKHIPDSALELLEKRIAEYRTEQLSRLALDNLARKNMPDFTNRARELYETHKQSEYNLPLRLRVRVIEQHLTSSEPETVQVATGKLQQLRQQIQVGDLDFKQAVLQHSDAANKKLTQGDSHWFRQGQKPPVFFKQASQLKKDNPLSEVFRIGNTLYLLTLLERKEAKQLAFSEVKASISADLKKAYLEQQRKILLESFQERFKNEVTIHPDFL